MKNPLLSLMSVAVLLGICATMPAQSAAAAEWKPLAIVSVASYDELAADVVFAASLSQDPQISQKAEIMGRFVSASLGLADLDQTRPWGFIAQTDGTQYGGFGFLPITDAKQLQEIIRPFAGEITDLGNGIIRIDSPESSDRPAFIKQQEGGWLFFSQKVEWLENTPSDPTALLNGLNKSYDIAVRAIVTNIPESVRVTAITELTANVAKDLPQHDSESDAEYSARKFSTKRLPQCITSAVNNSEAITLGISLDRETGSLNVDLIATAKEDTVCAQRLAKLADSKTDFAGFRRADAAVTLGLIGKLYFGNEEQLAPMLEDIQTSLLAGIDKDPPPFKAEIAKQLIRRFMKIVQEALVDGRVDTATSLLLAPERATLISGKYVPDGKKVEDALNALVDAVRKEAPELVSMFLTTDVEEYKGVRFHVISMPIGPDVDNREQLVALIGETADVVIGIGDKATYLAAGRDALETLKQAIATSQESGSEEASPLALTIAVDMVAQLAAEVAESSGKEEAAKLVAAMAKTAGENQIRLTVTPVERGLKASLVLEKGILQVIGKQIADQAK